MASIELKPAQRVRIIQTIHTRQGDWRTEVEGEVVSFSSQPTGSWFAHGKHNRLWLPRLRLKRDDGEIVDLILDRDSRAEVLDDKKTGARL